MHRGADGGPVAANCAPSGRRLGSAKLNNVKPGFRESVHDTKSWVVVRRLRLSSDDRDAVGRKLV